MDEAKRKKSDEPGNDASEQFVKLLMEHRHRLYAFIAKQLVNPADVEDVFQKTSMVLWNKADQFDTAGSFFHWACGIAFNEVRNFVRVQSRSKLYFDEDLATLLAKEAIEENELTKARLVALGDCLAQLSKRQQEILRRCYIETTTISDVAKELGRDRSALYKQLSRLKEKLASCIQRNLITQGASQ